jgi:hypothetical protein
VPAWHRDRDKTPGAQHALGLGQCAGGLGEVVQDVEQRDGAEPPVNERQRHRVGHLVRRRRPGEHRR